MLLSKVGCISSNCLLTGNSQEPITDPGKADNVVAQKPKTLQLLCVTGSNKNPIFLLFSDREGKKKKEKTFLPVIGMKALRCAVHFLFHLLSSSEQLSAYDTLQWELHIHKTSCHWRFQAITSRCWDISGRAASILPLTLLWTPLFLCHSI